MQRKRRNINFGYFSGSSGKSKFNNSITKLTLHSIPTVRMSEKSNEKSDVCIKFCPICGKEDIYQPTSVVWWRSPHCRSSERRNRTRASHVVMTPHSRIGRYLKLPLYIICTLLLSFVVSGMMNDFGGECYAAVNPTASLSVSNPTLSTTVAPGDTAYLSSNVTYSASDIDSYTLQVSYANGYNSLKLDGGTTTLTGANGTSGSSLANNSWGFAWTNNTTNNTSTNAGLTYYTVPTYGTNGSGLSTGRLENATLPESANNTLSSTTKRIVFAAKFAENNTNSGHYKTGVQLSMIATPKQANQLSEISTMQELYNHPEICTNTPFLSGKTYSEEYTLVDDRTYPTGISNAYKVRKFGDDRCWMTENLRINNTTLKAASSDFSGSDIVLPNSTKANFFNDNTSKYSYQSYLSTASEASAGVSGYYNWYTATAGAGNSSETTDNKSLNTSICPKGWKLPSGGSNSSTSEFRKFATAESIASTSAGSTKIRDIPYNFQYTGLVNSSSLTNADYGCWWSSTTISEDTAYLLAVVRTDVSPGNTSLERYLGLAVRCIARN